MYSETPREGAFGRTCLAFRLRYTWPQRGAHSDLLQSQHVILSEYIPSETERCLTRKFKISKARADEIASSCDGISKWSNHWLLNGEPVEIPQIFPYLELPVPDQPPFMRPGTRIF